MEEPPHCRGAPRPDHHAVGFPLGLDNEREHLFVLLGRDAAAPFAIRAWVQERIRLGKNTPTDPQITEALECALQIEGESGGAVRVNVDREWDGDEASSRLHSRFR